MRYIKTHELLRALTLPLLFVGVMLTLQVIWTVFNLPIGDELITTGRAWFDAYGYAALFLSAVLEGALVLGFYYPGGFIIVLSVVIAGHDPLKVAAIVALVSVAFVIGLSIDYVLGRYGWYHLLVKLGFREEIGKAEQRLYKHGLKAIFLTYWHINIASFTATAAGVLRYPYLPFFVLSILAFLLWNSLWASLVYFIGPKVLTLVSGNIVYALIAIGVWMLAILFKHVVDNRRATRLVIG